jgi:activator of HSP90 ATPase
MAKWGEGDPRWIVEERPDATNVNNWHWTEKNADAWSKKKLEELFVNSIIEDPKIGQVVIEEMEKCEGEARANNRKAKLIFFYEWEIMLKWKGHLNGNDKEVKGKVEICNLSEEHENMEDVDLEVTVSTKGTESEILKEMMRKGVGAKIIRDKMLAYVNALKTEFSNGLILPAKDSTPKPKVAQPVVNKSQTTAKTTEQIKNLEIGCKITLGSLELEEAFKCTGQEFFNAMTQKEMLQIFTAGEVKMKEATKGESFEMLGGNICGSFVEVVPFTKIVQKWRLKSWPAGHFSDVVIEIRQSTEDTRVKVKQTNVPEKEIDNTKMGWRKYYFEAMKRSFGFGATLI